MTDRVRKTAVLITFMLGIGGRGSAALASCQSFGGFAIRQCADSAYFDTAPFQLTLDPNGRPSNVTAVFWQIGFGNEKVSTGSGSDGTGVSNQVFNGNDHGLQVVDLLEGTHAGSGLPPGSLCLGANNWGDAGVDGCADDFRDPNQRYGHDDILNPYYDMFYARYWAFVGYYSLASQQDYPMAVLLTESSGRYFAYAAVATLNRHSTGNTMLQDCSGQAITNPATCDTRPGSYSFKDVSNGLPNATTPGPYNVVPWQEIPLLRITSVRPVAIGDPNAGWLVDADWNTPIFFSDESNRYSTNPTMGRTYTARGVGVLDIDAKFPLLRVRFESAPPSDPGFLNPSSTLTTGSSVSGRVIPADGCVRLKILFGKAPASPGPAECRLGLCGDIGYEVVSKPICPAPGDCHPEICDNLDNDCDGVVDEIATTCGVGACRADGECFSGVDSCAPGSPQPETCDGLDNDCDGSVDEGDPGGGAACRTAKPGVCADGTVTCSNGSLRCLQHVASSPEVCDGLDNDCDGSVDEGIPGVGGPCRNPGVGECGAGTLVCAGAGLDCVATGHVQPVDACDGLDNDCDGIVDEDACVAGGCGPCATGGVGVCSAGHVQCAGGSIQCVPDGAPSPESCNGLDDDCDGGVDEGNPGGGVPCRIAGVGECGAGVTACSGGALECVGNGAILPEDICDGLDNDCDGGVDEDACSGLGCPACSTGGQGACAAGHPRCENGVSQCVLDAAPTSEVCDGVDNDCDGLVDEANAGGGAPCTTGLPGECEHGIVLCTDGALRCTPTSNHRSPVDLCDGLDNDCDGVTDEDPCGLSGCAACPTGLPGPCGPGVLRCDAGALACAAIVPPSSETCDGADNDCDGVTDEDNPQGGAPCATGEPGECAAGVVTCSSGALRCLPVSAHRSPVDACDGLDNDCDGVVDEDTCAAGECGACPMGLPGVCATGQRRCAGGALVCDPTSQPGPDVCDGLDNDCDGRVDEDGACDLIVQGPPGALDCRRTAAPPALSWFPGRFEKFEISIAPSPDFARATKGKVRGRSTWSPTPAAWRKACARAGSTLYVRVAGDDDALAKKDPGRRATGPPAEFPVVR